MIFVYMSIPNILEIDYTFLQRILSIALLLNIILIMILGKVAHLVHTLIRWKFILITVLSLMTRIEK